MIRETLSELFCIATLIEIACYGVFVTGGPLICILIVEAFK
jgi:hypothetical protein